MQDVEHQEVPLAGAGVRPSPFVLCFQAVRRLDALRVDEDLDQTGGGRHEGERYRAEPVAGCVVEVAGVAVVHCDRDADVADRRVERMAAITTKLSLCTGTKPKLNPKNGGRKSSHRCGPLSSGS